MRYNRQEQKRLQQQKIAELRHQLRYTNSATEREHIVRQIDACRRHF
ncbi:MAG: hypothetical protein AAF892_09405 [Cyanobacteria bacterium P01_D01_bin.71]